MFTALAVVTILHSRIQGDQTELPYGAAFCRPRPRVLIIARHLAPNTATFARTAPSES
ncbi:hypothetical protein GCM10010470_28380 [Saccharopolyspora taberi]|uniref:Uncharacterized protein n=1 Tax=Saccharopolyspora taberi TaxID=60895 RepID=A0ABN3VEA7_9PSEU